MQKKKESLPEGSEAWTDYLDRNHLRRTPERLTLYKAVSSMNGHFGVDELYDALVHEAQFRVSRATIYSTLQLLVDAHLLVRHQFGTSAAVYERTELASRHHHVVCTMCGSMTEKEDARLRGLIQEARYARFSVSYYSLYIYGLCSRCKRKVQLTAKKSKK